MVNLCICSMQVHQSRFSLSFLPSIFPIFILSGCFLMLAGLCASVRVTNSAPLRSHSSPHCCSWPPFSELGRGTCTCRRLGTGTCTQWLRRAGCCGDGTEIRLVTQDTPVWFTESRGSNEEGKGMCKEKKRILECGRQLTFSWSWPYRRCEVCRSWAGQWGWPSWPVSHRTQASGEAEKAQSPSWTERTFWELRIKFTKTG